MSKLLDKYDNDESISYDSYELENICNLKFNLDNIEKVNFTKCKFENVIFEDLYFGKIIFQNCEFMNCDFINVNFNEITFKDSKLTNVFFDKGKAVNLEIVDSIVQYCHFSLLSVINGKFSSRFSSCFFEGTLSKCDFATSEFIDWKIENLNCDQVFLDKCKIESVEGDLNNFKGATISMAQALDFIIEIGIEIKEIS